MTSECDNLDAYLADDLSAAAAAQFARHAERCESCRETIAQQRWIDELFCSSERASLEPVPPALHTALNNRPPRRRHPARLIACGLAAAATLSMVAVTWPLKDTGPASDSRETVPNHVASTKPPANKPAPPRAAFVSNGDTIAVPVESADENVTIVQLYPTTETVRRTRNELALELLYPESDGG